MVTKILDFINKHLNYKILKSKKSVPKNLVPKKSVPKKIGPKKSVPKNRSQKQWLGAGTESDQASSNAVM